MKNALTVATNIKLSFLNDRDPPFHTGGPPADVAEDEAEEVGGGHIESHHYLGLVGERKGREAEHTFNYLHRRQLPAQAQQLGSLLPKQHATAQGGDKHAGPTAQSWHGCLVTLSLLGPATKGATCLEEVGGRALITSGRHCGTAGWLGYPGAHAMPEERF